MSLSVWLSFFVATLLLSLTPGAGAINTMSSALSYGVRKTFWSILGLQLALLVHLCLVAVGLGAVLATSAEAFTLMKYLGAGYLVFLGVQKWRERVETREVHDLGTATQSDIQLLQQGFWVNLTNPKSIIFFGAFLPQFLNVQQPLLGQYAQMGTTIVLVDIIVMLGFASLAHQAKNLLNTPRKVRLQNRFFGSLFIVAGGLLASAHH